MSGYVGTSPGTTTIQLDDGRVIQFTDWIDDKHYSTIQWQNGDNSELDAFTGAKSQPIIGGTRPATNVDTNIPRTGDIGLPKDWEFLVYSLAVELTRATRLSGSNTEPLLTDYSNPVDLPTYFELNRKLFFQYYYNGKDYATGLMYDFPSGCGFWWQGTQTAREYVSNGRPDASARVALVLPLDEVENLGYRMAVTPVVSLTISQTALDASTALTFVDMRVKKYGLIKRQVN